MPIQVSVIIQARRFINKELNLAIPAQNERLLLRFPRLGSLARVWVNGKEVVTVWCSPWEADITSYVHEVKII